MDGLPSHLNPEMLRARMMRGASWIDASRGGSEISPAEQKQQVPETRPGFFVDFTGCEDLLEEFDAAARKAGMTPSDSALDLIYLFANGDLRLKV